MNEMQAIKLLENVTAQVSMNRESHAQVMNAIRILSNFITIKSIPPIKDEKEKESK